MITHREIFAAIRNTGKPVHMFSAYCINQQATHRGNCPPECESRDGCRIAGQLVANMARARRNPSLRRGKHVRDWLIGLSVLVVSALLALVPLSAIAAPAPVVTVVVAQAGHDYQSRAYLLEWFVRHNQEWFREQLGGKTWDYRIVWNQDSGNPWEAAYAELEKGTAGDGVLLYITADSNYLGFAGSNQRVAVVGGSLLRYLWGAVVPEYPTYSQGVLAHELSHALGVGNHNYGIMREGVASWPRTSFDEGARNTILASGYVH